MKTPMPGPTNDGRTHDQIIAELVALFPPPKPGPIERKLAKALNESTGERDIHAFLKKHPFLIGMAFRSNTHPAGVISEFRLGAEFRCDFIVLSYCSAWWSVDLVELEAPNSRLYLADGTEGKTL